MVPGINVPLKGALPLGPIPAPFDSSEVMDDENPPIRRLTLKSREIVPTDTVAFSGDGTATKVRPMHGDNGLGGERLTESEPDSDPPFPGALPRPRPIPFHFRHELKDLEKESESSSDDSFGVEERLRENLLVEQESEELLTMPAPRRSRRRQDFALILGVAAAATGVLILIFRDDSRMEAIGMCVIVLLTVVLAWVMFGVLDGY
jgi:hypothetical protein